MRTELVRGLILGLCLVVLAGCATRHFTEMMLYECSDVWDCELSKDTYQVYQANNPIYVQEKAKVSLELAQVNPGWIHQDRTVDAPAGGADSRRVTIDQSEHISGKELWIVSRVVALTANSPMELEGKTYFKVSNLKFGTQSFRSIPLDLSEGRIFTHSADGSYRIKIRVYEVDGFELKRALVKVYRENPGIGGILKGAWDTVVSSIGSLAGDATVSLTKSLLRIENIEDPLVVESILLQGGASLEMEATVHLYTASSTRSEADRGNGWIEDTNYLLYDKWKSEQMEAKAWDYSFKDQAKYAEVQALTEAKISNGQLTGKRSFVRLRVSQSEAPAESAAAADVLKAHDDKQAVVDRIRAHQSLTDD